MVQIKVITFDLDNTLWDVEHVIVNAERRMREWLESELPGFNERFDAEQMYALRSALIEQRPELAHDLSQLRELALFDAIRAWGHSEAVARTHARHAFELFFEARHEVVFFDGVLDTLADLAERYTLGALTNGNASIEKLGLGDVFSFGYSSASVGASKPAPEMFRAALEHAGARPAESVHVGDHLVDDVQGAAEVGMFTIWVNARGHDLPQDVVAPHRTVKHVTEVPNAVTSLREL